MMARCGCGGGSGCGCRIVAGPGILISGSGQPGDPFLLEATVTSFAASFFAQDTDSVDLDLRGAGTEVDPFVLRANVALALLQLTDVIDVAGPDIGDTVVWTGTNFTLAPPPTVPPGTVNTSSGVIGDGTLSNPIHVAVSNTTTTATTGLATYVDSAGKLRAVPPTAVDTSWDAITGKPAAFPTTWDTVTGKPASYPDSSKVAGHAVFVQAAQPTVMALNDIWIKRP
jgi:hypothetical protein